MKSFIQYRIEAEQRRDEKEIAAFPPLARVPRADPARSQEETAFAQQLVGGYPHRLRSILRKKYALEDPIALLEACGIAAETRWAVALMERLPPELPSDLPLCGRELRGAIQYHPEGAELRLRQEGPGNIQRVMHGSREAVGADIRRSVFAIQENRNALTKYLEGQAASRNGSTESVETALNGRYAGILLDVDGTIIDQHDRVIPDAFRVLHVLSAAGVPIGIATGRSGETAKMLFQPPEAFANVTIYGRNGMECLRVERGAWVNVGELVPPVVPKLAPYILKELLQDAISRDPVLQLVAIGAEEKTGNIVTVTLKYRHTTGFAPPTVEALAAAEERLRMLVDVPEEYESGIADDSIVFFPRGSGKGRILETFREQYRLEGPILRIGDQGSEGFASERLGGARIGRGVDYPILNHPNGFSTIHPSPGGWKLHARSDSVAQLLLNCTFRPPVALLREGREEIQRQYQLEMDADLRRDPKVVLGEYASLGRDIIHALVDADIPEGHFRSRIHAVIDAFPSMQMIVSKHGKDSAALQRDHVRRFAQECTRERLHIALRVLRNTTFDASINRSDLRRALRWGAEARSRGSSAKDPVRTEDQLLDELADAEGPLARVLSLWCRQCECLPSPYSPRDEHYGQYDLFEYEREERITRWINEAAVRSQNASLKKAA